MTSIAFIPEEYANGLPVASFTYLANKSINVNGTNAGADWKLGSAINASNKVELAYRLNPSDAFIAPTASVAYIDRAVKTRAAGDGNNVLSGSLVESASDDAIAVATSINLKAYEAITKDNKSDKNTPIAALQLTNGQKTFTSDYIVVEAASVSAVLVDKAKTAKNKAAYTSDIYSRTKKEAASNQTPSAYVSQFVGTEAAEELAYDGSLDVSTIPGLYVSGKGFLEDLGFDNVRFEYILPESYIIGGTDQQYFVQLNGNILSVKDNIGGKSQAIGRTPVVLINAYVGDNLVATAYVLIKVVSATGVKDDINVTIGGTSAMNYVDVPKAGTVKPGNTDYLMGELGWQAINSNIYGALGLTSTSFNQNYTGPVVTVTIPVTWKEGNNTKTDNAVYTLSGTPYSNNDVPGLKVNADLSATATTTNAPIRVWIDNMIHTQDGTLANAKNAKGEVLGNGNVNIAGASASYTVDIVYKSNTAAVRGDVVISKTFTITETHEALIYSNFVVNNKVESFGAINGSAWDMMFNLTNAFKRGDNNTDIFTYLNGSNTINNVKGITITGVKLPSKKINNNNTELLAALDANGAEVTGLVGADGKFTANCAKVRKISVVNPEGLVNLPATATVSFKLTLANGETCSKEYSFDVTFNNPFVAAPGSGLTLNGNAVLANPLDVKPQFGVNDHNGEKIYNWGIVTEATETDPAVYGLVLSDVAKNGYKVANAPAITYDFDQASKDYIAGMGAGKLSINNTTGEVEYVPGAVLQASKTLTIEAKATFKSGSNTISIVVCKIPLNVTTGN